MSSCLVGDARVDDSALPISKALGNGEEAIERFEKIMPDRFEADMVYLSCWIFRQYASRRFEGQQCRRLRKTVEILSGQELNPRS